MWGMVARLEARVGIGDAARQHWYDAQAAIRPREGRPHAVRRSILANALSLIHFDDDADVRDLQRLDQEIGSNQTVSLQDEVLAAIDPVPGRPLVTQLVRTLGERAWGKSSRTPGSLTHDDPDLRELCAGAALRLLMVDDGEDDRPLPTLTTEEALLEVFRGGDAGLWRRMVATALSEPWAGRTEHHLSLLDPDERPGEFQGIQALAGMARRIAEEDERRAVADHIRSTIAGTGLTQREFASLVGTSPSRLSTYVTGSVTPSAAMLLRINRMAKRARSSAHGVPDGPA